MSDLLKCPRTNSTNSLAACDNAVCPANAITTSTGVAGSNRRVTN